MLGISTSNLRVGGFRKSSGNDADAVALYSRIIADGGVSDLTRLNYFVVGLKTIYGSLANVPVCYDAHWIGYKLGSGTGATAGQAAAKLYSLTVAGDAVQATAASQPLLLSHNGASSDNYWWGSGVSGNFMSTPNAAANQITGDIEIIAKCSIDNIANTVIIVSKDNSSSDRSYTFFYDGANGKLNLGVTISPGTTFAYIPSSVSAGLSANIVYFLKATRQASTGDTNFYKSLDGVTYTQIGTTVSSLAGNIRTYSSTLFVGVLNNSVAPFQGKIYRATISNSIGGTPVVDFNPATYNASTSQTQWTSTTGEVWTINTGTATTGYKGVLVDRTIVQGDGVDDTIFTSTNVVPATNTIYTSFNAYASTGGSGKTVVGTGALSGSLFQLSDTQASGWYSASVVSISINKNIKNLDLVAISANGTAGAVKIQKNNGTIVSLTGTAIAQIATLMGNTTYGQTNCLINTIIVSQTDNDATTRTATYNLIRSLNNNAF